MIFLLLLLWDYYILYPEQIRYYSNYYSTSIPGVREGISVAEDTLSIFRKSKIPLLGTAHTQFIISSFFFLPYIHLTMKLLAAFASPIVRDEIRLLSRSGDPCDAYGRLGSKRKSPWGPQIHPIALHLWIVFVPMSLPPDEAAPIRSLPHWDTLAHQHWGYILLLSRLFVSLPGTVSRSLDLPWYNTQHMRVKSTW